MVSRCHGSKTGKAGARSHMLIIFFKNLFSKKKCKEYMAGATELQLERGEKKSSKFDQKVNGSMGEKLR